VGSVALNVAVAVGADRIAEDYTQCAYPRRASSSPLPLLPEL